MIGAAPYNGSLTRETFLFYEMRSTAKLLLKNMPDKDIETYIVSNNLFQYPTEKTIARCARVCLKRLHALSDFNLIEALATQPIEVGKQICIYAMMRQSRLVWEFMITVIGEKYRLMDTSFGKIDINSFFMRLQEQNDTVASWSDSTIKRIKSTLMNMLVEAEYLDNSRTDHLNSVWLFPILENAIRNNGDEIALPAFNCLT